MLEIARIVRAAVSIPVAMKLLPFFSAFPKLVRELGDLGIEGVILFNRFYQPGIDLDHLEAPPKLRLSRSEELELRLPWLATLAGRVKPSLAVSGGVHTAHDALRAVMAGADAVQVVSALLQNGPDHLRTMRRGMVRWLEEHRFESLQQVQGCMSLARVPDTKAAERGTYMRHLQIWRLH